MFLLRNDKDDGKKKSKTWIFYQLPINSCTPTPSHLDQWPSQFQNFVPLIWALNSFTRFHPRVRNLGGRRAGPVARPGRRTGMKRRSKTSAEDKNIFGPVGKLRSSLTWTAVAGITPWTQEQDVDHAISAETGAANSPVYSNFHMGGALGGKLVSFHLMFFVCRYSGYGGCSESESEWAEDRDGWSDRCNQYIIIIFFYIIYHYLFFYT